MGTHRDTGRFGEHFGPLGAQIEEDINQVKARCAQMGCPGGPDGQPVPPEGSNEELELGLLEQRRRVLAALPGGWGGPAPDTDLMVRLIERALGVAAVMEIASVMSAAAAAASTVVPL